MGADAIVGLVTSIINRIWPDKSEMQKLEFAKELQLSLAQADLNKNQMEVNKEQAKSTSLFVSGPRPFIMWVSGLSFAWQFLLQPFITYVIVVFGGHIGALPVFDYNALNTVLFGLLGLGAFRTYEKVKGVTK